MERTFVYLLTTMLLIASVNPAFAWTLVRERDGITVWKRQIEGSAIAQSLAKVTVESKLSPLVALIMDVDNEHSWIDSVDRSESLKQISASKLYGYTLSNAPWPVADRDAVVLTEASQDPVTCVVQIHSHATPDQLPEKEGVVRIQKIDSLWTLTPQAGGKVEISYQLHSDPGGNLPAWLINSMITDQPFNTLRNLRNIIGKSPYKDARSSFIIEPATQ